ncbi:hypothetical protein ABT369_44045 [Dactylosporangium sp. NPDC000244]|uniref:hypothetical protein n=1 Tax=Dactylosporangium sp. NPDC000244 TaxID=3154365 RepID=UPI0033232D32
MNIRFALPVWLPVFLLAAAGLAGCSDGNAAESAAPPASNAPVVPTYTSPAPSAGASSKAPAAGASGAASGCPVTAAVLQKAFQGNAEVAGALVLGKGLKDISCYAGWATAVTQPTNLDPAVVLFKYDAAKKTWAAVIGGTDGVCRETVPEDVATHLKGCQN